MKKTKLFTALFVGSLILPNLIFFGFRSHFDTKNYENRTLAGFPALETVKSGEFSSAFESYYSDHVPFKNYFVKFNNTLDTTLFQTTKIGDVVIGTDNWLFYLTSHEGEDALADYQKTNQYSEEKCAETAKQITDTEQWFRDQGAEHFCYYVAPNKETIYSEYMPKKPSVIGDGGSRMDEFAAYLQEKTDVSFQWLAKEMKQCAETYQIFCKYDTHMNNLGGFFVSQKILNDLGFETPEVSALTIENGETYQGDLAQMIGKSDTLTDDFAYQVNGYQEGVSCEAVKKEGISGSETFVEFASDSTNDRTLLVVGDSFRLRLMTYLPYWYKHCIFVNIDNFTPEIMEEYQPEDVVLITVERDQRYMEQLFKYFS